MKKITQQNCNNGSIQWILENDRNTCSENDIGSIVRFLIDEHNKLVDVINTLQASTYQSKLLLADVSRSLLSDDEIRKALENSIKQYDVNVWIDGAKWMRDYMAGRNDG